MAEQHRYEVYPDKAGEWRWRKRSRNNRTTADSGEGYVKRAEAIAAARNDRDTESVILLREDGSLVGELNHAETPGGEAQRVTVDPASENGEAGL